MSSPPTHNERVAFHIQYPALSSLLAAFLEGQEEGITSEESIKKYLKEELPECQREAISEGFDFLRQEVLPWTLIPEDSNVHQPTAADARAWLSKILASIEATLKTGSGSSQSLS